MRGACAIVGVGDTPFTRGTDKSTLELHLEASLQAISDAGVEPADIDAVLPSSLAGLAVEDFIACLGLTDLAYSATTHMGGSSLIASVQTACMAVTSGVATCVLVPAGRRGFSGERISTGNAVRHPAAHAMHEFEIPLGNVGAPQWFAQAAQRHMHQYGTTSEQLAHVAMNSRRNANLNPHAYMHGRPMTLEDHQSSPMITTPFRMLDCSLETDGAGALLVTSVERARQLRRPVVTIAGVGQSHSSTPLSLTESPDMAVVQGVRTAAKRALDMAEASVTEMDLFNIHEGFSWYVIAALEALGVVPPGEGGPYVQDGNIALEGPTPVNPHGGALSEGHASGVNHVIEAVRQLRREVEPARQIVDVESALVVNEGGFFDGAALVLRRDR
ncbi:thiolase family protein [Nocardioides alcanivorans]|uniref:thiolase family protein n=1 Tax=Nocardioides alcanivorans TaxID=2897352 RepID=UPI001F2DC240|nr:thiolase family protein [Nocardioides alcanivorans]